MVRCCDNILPPISDLKVIKKRCPADRYHIIATHYLGRINENKFRLEGQIVFNNYRGIKRSCVQKFQVNLNRIAMQSCDKNIFQNVHFFRLKYLANCPSQQPHQKRAFKLDKIKQKPILEEFYEKIMIN